MRAVVRRLVQLVVVVLFVSFFSFYLLTLVPGDPVTAIAGFVPDPAQHAAIAKDLGVSDPIPVQYANWLGNFVRGDLGKQYFGPTGEEKVSTVVGQRLPVSLQLMTYTMILTLLIAIPLGVLAAHKAGTWIDKIVNFTAFGSISLPDFALAIVLIYWVAVRNRWLPSEGYVHPTDNFVLHIKHMVLPAFSLAVGQIAAYMRLLRSDMIATLQEDYILMAKSKGLTTRRVLWRHALRPSSLTLLTVAGLNIGALIGGAVVIEVLFGIPGMGTELFQAIFQHQFVELQSLVAIIALGYVAVNALIDVLYTVLDPRIRDARALA
jgi:peptide/nickel transport system permease protein